MKKNEISTISVTSNFEDMFSSVNMMMNRLDAMGLKTAEFTNGTFYKDDGSNQMLASNGIMAIRNEDEIIIRKALGSSQVSTNRQLPFITQDVYAKYKGTSQPSISNEESKLK